MPQNEDAGDEIAPFDDDRPTDELVSEDEGWSQKRYDEMLEEFKKLNNDDIDEFVTNFMALPQPREEMSKEEIFKFIAENHSYEEVVERYDEI